MAGGIVTWHPATNNAVVNAIAVAKDDGFASKKEKIIVIAGVPFNVAGTTNILRVVSIEGKDVYE